MGPLGWSWSGGPWGIRWTASVTVIKWEEELRRTWCHHWCWHHWVLKDWIIIWIYQVCYFRYESECILGLTATLTRFPALTLSLRYSSTLVGREWWMDYYSWRIRGRMLDWNQVWNQLWCHSLGRLWISGQGEERGKVPTHARGGSLELCSSVLLVWRLPQVRGGFDRCKRLAWG